VIVLALARGARPEPGSNRWIYVGEDTTWRAQAEAGVLAGLTRVPTGELVEEAAWHLRDAYIEWIGQLSAANSSAEWWASELAAKNPFSLFYPRLCALAAGQAALSADSSPALIVCATPALLHEMSRHCDTLGLPWRRAGRHTRRPDLRPLARRAVGAWARRAPASLASAPARRSHAVARAFDDSADYRRRVLAGIGSGDPAGFDGPTSALLFTWADERSYDGGRYRDPHFGVLPELLGSAGWSVAYVPRVLPSAPFADVVRGLRATGERMYFPDAWVRRSDQVEAEGIAEAWMPHIPDDAAVGAVRVAALAREHVEDLRYRHAEVLTHGPLIRRLAAAGVHPAQVILPFEGHSWEHALTQAVREHMPETRVLGFDNVNFSRLALSLYPARSEFGTRPLPDRIVASGETFRQILLKEGYPEQQVRLGCALRHTYLESTKPRASDEERTRRTVLVATSIDTGQSYELIAKAAEAFAHDPLVDVVVKLHPAVVRGAIEPLLTRVPGRESMRFADQPIGDLLREADAMLYTYSVVCYEALAAGVPPVFVKSETFLDLDQLEPYPELRATARTPDEIRVAVAAALARSEGERADWIERAQAAVREALRPVDDACVGAFIEP
jgi:hypothetical protein